MGALFTAVAIAVAGALGALSRVGLEQWLGGDPLSPTTLAVTLGVNTAGALALGLLRREHSLQPPPWLRQALGVGFLGAFTTWSAVMVQVHLLTTDVSAWWAVSYLVATLGLGLVAAWWGLASRVRRGPEVRP